MLYSPGCWDAISGLGVILRAEFVNQGNNQAQVFRRYLGCYTVAQVEYVAAAFSVAGKNFCNSAADPLWFTEQCGWIKIAL